MKGGNMFRRKPEYNTIVTGKALTKLAKKYGLKRRFVEPDFLLKSRMRKVVRRMR